jgi:putative ABC transport system substrate-binding protein
VLWNPTSDAPWEETGVLAQGLGLQPPPLEATGSDAFDSAFDDTVAQRAEALVVLSDPLTVSGQARLGQLAAERHLPAMFSQRGWVEAGGLMAYGPNIADSFRRAAVFVDKILQGAKPADLPVEQPTKFDLILNLKSAQALGLTIPQSILSQSTEVIQ